MQRMLMQIKQRVLEVVDEMTMVASRPDESCAMVSSLTEEVQQREESKQCGRDREKHNVTEAMVQIRERSRRARRTGSDGEDSCDHVQNTARGVVSSAPSRRSSKRSSVGKVPVCKTGEQREILKNVQVENAVEVEIQGRENLLRHCFSHSTERTVRLEFDNSQRREREGDTGFQ